MTPNPTLYKRFQDICNEICALFPKDSEHELIVRISDGYAGLSITEYGSSFEEDLNESGNEYLADELEAALKIINKI